MCILTTPLQKESQKDIFFQKNDYTNTKDTLTYRSIAHMTHDKLSKNTANKIVGLKQLTTTPLVTQMVTTVHASPSSMTQTNQ